MRRRNTELHARVNGNLAFEFTDAKLTSYAGLELFDRYLRQMGFSKLVCAAFSDARLGGDFGVIAMVRVLIGLLVVGGRRLDHLRYLATDPLLRRFARVRVWPTARTVSRWLKRFTMKSVEHLAALNAAVIAQIIPRLQLRTLTFDVDWVVVSTGLRSNELNAATTRIGVRSPATIRSRRTWLRPRTCCGCEIARGTCTTAAVR